MFPHHLLAIGRIQFDPLKWDLMCLEVLQDLVPALAAFGQ